MENNNRIKEDIKTQNIIDTLLSNKKHSEKELLALINEISKLFNFHINQLRYSFNDNKSLFYLRFKAYLLVIDSFTKLCLTFSTNKEKRALIDNILQILNESKSMLKLFVPLEENEIKILNNLIGQQLYYYTHINYIKVQNKEINYLLEEYHLNLEKIIHGYELSFESDFGNKSKLKEIFKENEKMIFLNNASFLLLKMIYKFNYHMSEKKYNNNPNFIKIVNLFLEYSKLSKYKNIKTILEFEKVLIQEFENSARSLNNSDRIDVFDEKIKLLKVDTDEYKQLIDIIMDLKPQVI